MSRRGEVAGIGWRTPTVAWWTVQGGVFVCLLLAEASPIFVALALLGALALHLFLTRSPPRAEHLVAWTGEFSYDNRLGRHGMELSLDFEPRGGTGEGTIKGYGRDHSGAPFRVSGTYRGGHCAWTKTYHSHRVRHVGTREGDRIRGHWFVMDGRGRFDVCTRASAEGHAVEDLADATRARAQRRERARSLRDGFQHHRRRGTSRATLALTLRRREGVGGRCPYCRDAIDARHRLEVSTCQSCATPFHRACLAEAGGCTTLGCESPINRRVSA